MDIEQIIFFGLVAWRLGYFLTDDYLLQDSKEWLLGKLPETRSTRYLTVLLYCIYCITFWTAIIVTYIYQPIFNILLIWATATLFGVLHNHYSKEPTEENIDTTDIE